MDLGTAGGPADRTSRSRPGVGLVVRTGWPGFLWLVGTLLLVTMLVHIAALAITGGPVTGPVSLRKPATFAEATWLVCWSVALLLPKLRTRAWQRHVIGTAAVLFGVVETTVMAIQAWRGVPSHYNFTTPLDAALMRGGAAGTAGVFLVGVVVLLVATIRTPDLAPSVRLGVLAGAFVLFVGCAVGLVMISNNSGVYQGIIGGGFARQISAYLGPSPATVGHEYLLLRPYTQGGDLVLPHAIGIHGLVLLAVPAVLLTHTTLSRARQFRIVAVATAGVTAALLLLLVHAFRQLPLDRLHPVTLAALAGCTVAVLVGYATVGFALVKRCQPVSAGAGA